ncbi:multiprotein-bridging factor 1 family protein [Bifidobacterium tibiigranuli]|jgi:transcriptional regulator with XRE-family HTH domain|uniref:multiprotein-bridging factor 1 family protein n=1 Tax=Bifidobacterium tibiigranuli TaxID=2172043 RepID=UPI0034C64754
MSCEEYANDDAIVAQFLRSIRNDSGLSQSALAAQLGEPQSFVSKYENLHRRITVAQFIKITETLGIEPETAIHQLKARMSK